MFGFFKRKKSVAETPVEETRIGQAAPGTEIRYDSTLINQLQSEHQQLLGLYGAINESFREGDFESVSSQLNQFRTALQGHLLTENVRLYIYLEHLLRSDQNNYDLMHGFRQEMDGICKVALAFLKKYETIGVDADLAPSFERDFGTIGEVLGKRINAEESTLYPLYMPNI